MPEISACQLRCVFLREIRKETKVLKNGRSDKKMMEKAVIGPYVASMLKCEPLQNSKFFQPKINLLYKISNRFGNACDLDYLQYRRRSYCGFRYGLSDFYIDKK